VIPNRPNRRWNAVVTRTGVWVPSGRSEGSWSIPEPRSTTRARPVTSQGVSPIPCPTSLFPVLIARSHPHQCRESRNSHRPARSRWISSLRLTEHDCLSSQRSHRFRRRDLRSARCPTGAPLPAPCLHRPTHHAVINLRSTGECRGLHGASCSGPPHPRYHSMSPTVRCSRRPLRIIATHRYRALVWIIRIQSGAALLE